MFFTIIIAFFSLISLLVLHEFGHFVLAKRFCIKVEEFGVGYPPRIFGKKIGETTYSLNLLPFGAFVKILGEEGEIPGEKTPSLGIEDYRSFIGKPIWQRVLIVIGGAASFWIVAFILFSFIAAFLGMPTAVEDGASQGLINPKVQITKVLPNSPAEEAGLQLGDIILQLNTAHSQLITDKIKDVAEFVEVNRGEKITLTIQRENETFEAVLVPRVSPPENEGPMGVGLARVALKTYPWYQATIQGALITANITLMIPYFLGDTIWQVIQGKPAAVKIELRGPVGIMELINNAAKQGANYFLYIIAIISLHLAFFNILPIPALDGGKLLFLGVEAIRRRPVSAQTERTITFAFFTSLIILMVWVTIKDITRIF